MGREIRKVPMGYQHPVDENGHLQPMHDQTYKEALAEYQENVRQWNAGEYFDKKDGENPWEGTPAEEYFGPAPNPVYYRPEWPEDAELGIQLWEDTSEGTPISPVFPDTPEGKHELAKWAATGATTFGSFKASADDWFRMLFGEDKGIGVHHDITYPNGDKVTFI